MLGRVDGAATASRCALTDIYGTRPKEPPPGMTWKDWYQPWGSQGKEARNVD